MESEYFGFQNKCRVRSNMNTKINHQTKFSLSALALTATLSMSGIVQAQPNPAIEGKGENPPNWEERPNRRIITPEQRQQAVAQFRDQALRRVLTAGGFR